MRITFVLPGANLSSGVRVVAIYAERFKKLGHKVCLLYPLERKLSLYQQVVSLAKGNGLLSAPKAQPSHLDGLSVGRRVLECDGAGMLVNSEDFVGGPRAIEQICSFSTSKWQTMSNAAYATATQYTWDDATKLFEVALQNAIDRAKCGDLSELTT